MMRTFIFILIIGLFFSCAQDNEQSIVTTTVSDSDEVKVTEKVEIDPDIENNKISLLNQSLVTAVNSRDRNPVEVTAHWIGTGTVLMAHNFFGELSTSSTRQKIRGSWRSIFGNRDQWPMVSKIEEIWIEKKRGQLARAVGTFQFQANVTRPFKALFQKNKKGDWKIKAMDYGNSGYIKGYKIVL